MKSAVVIDISEKNAASHSEYDLALDCLNFLMIAGIQQKISYPFCLWAEFMILYVINFAQLYQVCNHGRESAFIRRLSIAFLLIGLYVYYVIYFQSVSEFYWSIAFNGTVVYLYVSGFRKIITNYRAKSVFGADFQNVL
mmetsp:Transcript_11/g.19  ORF Transcript_11/g.19 Transcript_11/m.19 type:complete len:139 (-) Transcript_11:39-455(-)